IVRDKQHLVPTAMGTGLIAALPVASLASPELTGAWEARLARIARGEETRAAFMADITRYVAELVDAIRTASPPPPPAAGAPAQAVPRGRYGRAPRRKGWSGAGGPRRPRRSAPTARTSRTPEGFPAVPRGATPGSARTARRATPPAARTQTRGARGVQTRE